MARGVGYQLIEADKALIRGMAPRQIGFNPFSRKVERRTDSNIGALYFDGPRLADLVKAHVEITEMNAGNRKA